MNLVLRFARRKAWMRKVGMQKLKHPHIEGLVLWRFIDRGKRIEHWFTEQP